MSNITFHPLNQLIPFSLNSNTNLGHPDSFEFDGQTQCGFEAKPCSSTGDRRHSAGRAQQLRTLALSRKRSSTSSNAPSSNTSAALSAAGLSLNSPKDGKTGEFYGVSQVRSNLGESSKSRHEELMVTVL